MKKSLFLITYLISCLFVWSQGEKSGEKDDFIFSQKKQHIKIQLKNDSLFFTNHFTEKSKFNTGNTLFLAQHNIAYNNFNAIENIDAHTTTPQGEKICVDHFETKDALGGTSFYSEDKNINFTFPAVTAGATTELNYDEIIDDPYFMSAAFSFGSGAYIKEAIFIVDVDKGVNLGYKTFNFDKLKINFKKEDKGNFTRYSWKSKGIPKNTAPTNASKILSYTPHMFIYIESYEGSKGKVEVLRNTDDLYALYWKWTTEIDRDNLEKLHQETERITQGLDTKEEKTKAIYNWVQNNISYIFFGDGYKGFIPDGAASVYEKRYGDCKGMSNILFEMLNYSGIEAYRTWIGSRNKPYDYEELPCLAVDDHMIVTALIDNQYYFLDGTDKYAPFGLPSSFIQGKEALLGIDKEKYRIIRVPEVNKEINKSIIETELTFNNYKLSGHQLRTLYGYEMGDFLSDYTYKKDDNLNVDEYMNLKYEIGNNKTQYSNISLDNLTSTEGAYLFNFDLDFDNYSKAIGNKIYINLNIEKPLSTNIVPEKRKAYGRYFDHKYTREYITKLNIPEGYSIKKIPDNINYTEKRFGFTISYKILEDKIISERSIYINTLNLQGEEIDDYNEFIKNLIASYKKNITLEKI